MIIIRLICFAVTAIAFTYGAVKLFRKGKSLYFQLYVLASGCFMLGRLIEFATSLCKIEAGGMTAAGFFGMISFSLFILSANRGALDGMVDDRCDARNKKARLTAFIAPAITAPIVLADVIVHIRTMSLWSGILLLVALFPIIPASYFNLKHLLLPMDEIELLRATRPCNIFALLFLVIYTVLDILSVLFTDISMAAVCGIGSSILAALIVVGAVEGDKRWKI